MTGNLLTELARLALDSNKASSFGEALIQATGVLRRQTGAVSVLVFYGEDDRLAACGTGDSPDSYPAAALKYLQQRLTQLRVPLAFNLIDGQVRYLTRAANKQPRDYVAWLVPVSSSWTELLILRGNWPATAVQPLLDTIDAALPALAIILERFLGVGRKERFQRQLSALESCVEAVRQSASVIGTATAMYSTFRALPSQDVALLQELSNVAAASLEEARVGRDIVESHLHLQEYASRLERAVQTERQKATTDPITGLLNGRGAIDMLTTAIEAAASGGSSVSLILGDIDGFKLFNDTHGHVVGDQVLSRVANVLRRVSEKFGTASRYGGDEFLIILPGLDKQSARMLAADIVEQLARMEFRVSSESKLPISMSIGIATYPEDSTQISSLVAKADAAMYAAKKRIDRHEVSVVSSVPETHLGVLEGLVLAIHAKDRYTKGHCDLVAECSVRIADHMRLPEESKRALSIAGLLHDIGKLVIPDEVLKKPGALSPDEYEIIKQHVRVGEVLIREVPQLQEVLQAVSCHHERYDGRGYPRGLKGQEIPLLGRIIGVADAYSAMSIDRPYRKAMPPEQVLSELIDGSGTQFDPEIVQAFGEIMLKQTIDPAA